MKNNISWFKNLSLALLTVVPLTTQAAIFHDVDTTESLKCDLSYRHHNRIMLEGGKIKSVVCPQTNVSIQLEQESGQVFIYPLENFDQEMTLSIVTSSGTVQDIEINFCDAPAGVIILRENCHTNSDANVACEPCPTASCIRQILRGEIPQGYTCLAINNVQWKPKRGILFNALSRLENENEVLFVYEIINVSDKEQVIFENELEGASTQWIYLETNMLKKREKALGIISFRREV